MEEVFQIINSENNGQYMLDINNPVEWQVRDEQYPTLKAWYTHGMLNEISKWNLKECVVLEYGGGWSSIFWAFHAKQVVTIETDLNWINDIREYADAHGITNLTLIHRPCNEGDQSKVEYYTEVPEGYNPDIVIVDGVLRNSCLEKALTLQRPLILIADNWQQSYVWISPSAAELMEPYPIHIFEQENHTNNDGINKWKTVYWDIK